MGVYRGTNAQRAAKTREPRDNKRKQRRYLRSRDEARAGDGPKGDARFGEADECGDELRDDEQDEQPVDHGEDRERRRDYAEQ